MTILDRKEFKRKKGHYSKKKAGQIAKGWRSKGFYARVVTRQSKGKKHHVVFTRKR
ncbi:hypothetical protein ES702_02608 [subsurface metagenome]